MDYRFISLTRNKLKQILYSFGIKYSEGHDYINIRCPHCGDSKRFKNKKRGFFFIKNNNNEWSFFYKCFNGGCEFNHSIDIKKYLKRFYPNEYSELKNELLDKSSLVNFSEFNWKKIEDEQKIKNELELKRRLDFEKEQTLFFIPLSANKDNMDSMAIHYLDMAIDFCKKRLIPESIYTRFFVSVGGKYHGRLIIPFYKRNGKPTYFQGRALENNLIPKYLNRYGNKQFYNIDFVDWSSPVIVTEGAIDSMFFNNSFALNGITSSSDEFKYLLNKYPDKLCFLFDRDDAGYKTAKQFIRNGYRVFLWKKFMNDCGIKINAGVEKVDWNDIVLITGKNMWDSNTLSKYFSSNPLDAIYIKG